jgi:[acyl-carrier-protein] S-malonyltransferase
MVAVLGSTVDIIEKILKDNEQNLNVQIANDNS